MLSLYDPSEQADEQILGTDMDELRAGLSALQQRLRAKGIPVVIVFEGFGASGKGVAISELIQGLDPRGYKVHTIRAENAEERRYPPMRRYWQKTPGNGQIAIFDRSWYRDVSTACMENSAALDKRKEGYARIARFERLLFDGGTVIIKLFLLISKKEQKKRLKALEEDKATRWRVTEDDWQQNKRYDEYYELLDHMLEACDFDFAPWFVIPAGDKKSTARRVYSVVLKRLGEAVSRAEEGVSPQRQFAPLFGPEPTRPIASLKQVDLSVCCEGDYRDRLKKAQKRLSTLHAMVYREKVPVILAFEGWDAAGKGGAIRRLTSALDPRGFQVNPTSAPSPEEKSHNYLWRFWNNVPRDGHIAIFDRTWYGRVMVERVEKLTPEEDWQRAYGEMNRFERELYDWGAVILKFWLHIDADEQLRRFQNRQNTPGKQWKITDEDWRNREKWPLYEQAVDEMLQKTNTEWAPWIVVESNDKRYARLKVIECVIRALERHMKKNGDWD